jgi:Phosphate-selective porin O and P
MHSRRSLLIASLIFFAGLHPLMSQTELHSSHSSNAGILDDVVNAGIDSESFEMVAASESASKATTSHRFSKRKVEKSKSLESRLKESSQLYKDEDNPFLQELWILGRYHGQYHDAEGSEGQDDGWENRRFRIGAQARYFEKLTLHAQMVSGPDMEPFYNGFTELWASWAFEDHLQLAIGQEKHRFTHDRNVSSRYMNTIERTMLLNMFAADYTPAITVSGKTDEFSYYTGIFSNATGTDIWDALTDHNSGFSLLASGTLDIKKIFETESAHWNTCYLYSDANEQATNLNRFKDGLSTALILTEGPYSLITEVLAGMRSNRGNAVGWSLQPGCFLTERFQLNARYQLAGSDDERGLVAQRRYERPAGLTTGDLYQAIYLGSSYYIAGHRAKLMQGIEYADLSGQHLWTATVAFRVFWGPDASGPFPIAKMLKP